MSKFDIDHDRATDMIQAIGDLLIEHLGVLPDVVLIVRQGTDARTFFAGNNLATKEHPNDTLRSMLEQALAIHDKRHPGQPQ